MFPFRKRRARDRGWLAWPTTSGLGNRRALLLSPRQFEREVARERLRSTRRNIPFCVLSVELLAAGSGHLSTESASHESLLTVRPSHRSTVLKRQTRGLVDILHHNLRVTDEKGVLSATRYGVLLVDTPEMGGRAVLDRLTLLFSAAALKVRLSLEVHDPDGFSDRDGQEPVSNHSPNNHRHSDRNDRDWARRPSVAIEAAVAVAERKETVFNFQTNGASHLTQSLPQATRRVESQIRVAADDVAHYCPFSLRVAKRTLDIVGAGTGLLLSAPILAAAILAIKWGDRGPAFFCQTREGRFGRPFTIYKLRTMIVDAEKAQATLRADSHRDGPAFKISNDPRVTKVGRFLRATCLDELPQLINVLKGDMSLVGPRPLPWHESRACERWHRRRLDVRPGLTCIWQIDKTKAVTFDDWMRMDLQYIDRLGFFKDLELIARTVVVPVTGRGSD